MFNVKKPNPFLDTLKEHLALDTDYALANRLGYSSNGFSRIRHSHKPITDEMIVSAHEETGISIARLKQLRDESDPQRKLTKGESQKYLPTRQTP